jgi:hypothetical protein
VFFPFLLKISDDTTSTSLLRRRRSNISATVLDSEMTTMPLLVHCMDQFCDKFCAHVAWLGTSDHRHPTQAIRVPWAILCTVQDSLALPVSAERVVRAVVVVPTLQ